MKKALITLTLILLCISGLPAYSGDRGVSATYDARTGDTMLDTTLGDLNLQTQGGNLSDFVSNLSLSYNVPRLKIEYLIDKVKMTPADAYMTIGIAKMAGKPIDEVVDEYEANKDKGWGVIAKRLGIKPGSKEFHALKKGGSAELEKAKGKDKDKSKGKDKKGSKKRKKGKKK